MSQWGNWLKLAPDLAVRTLLVIFQYRVPNRQFLLHLISNLKQLLKNAAIDLNLFRVVLIKTVVLFPRLISVSLFLTNTLFGATFCLVL